MDYGTKTLRISNVFYNRGLEQARIRDLTGAAQCLKRCLHFNKYHTDARNLLGLVFLETGEVSLALVQWVISMNLQPVNNRADYYLDEIQRKPGRLEVAAQNISKYNQALIHAQSGSDDLAVLQLTRVVEGNPNYVKAHLLLAIIYISREDYIKAGKSLYNVLQIDKNNPKALWYMSIVKKNTGRADVERKKLKNAFSHRQMQDDDIIMPPSYKETTGRQAVLYILAGLLIGVIFISFLVMPTRTRLLNNEHNQEIISYSKQLNEKNINIDALNKQIKTLEVERDNAVSQAETIRNDDSNLQAQYQTLIGILEAYRNDNFDEAVRLYTDFDATNISNPDVLAIVNNIKTDIDTNGAPVYAKLADAEFAAENYEKALQYYQNSINLNPDNAQLIYNMAMSYKMLDEKAKANELFGQVIMDYPDTELAVQAKAERGY